MLPSTDDGSCTSNPPHHRRKRTSDPNTMSFASGSALVRPALALLVSIFLSTTTLASAGQQDGNAPWGTGRPPRDFRMWWRDPSNVLEDLDQFSALYVRSHGCIWSEYGIDDYDDDGEGRDGDEEWYQGRTLPFRANVAYSLYGVMNGQFRLNHCSKSTYINTFITHLGADELLNTIGKHGLGNDDDAGYGNAYCTQMDAYDFNLQFSRELEGDIERELSGDGDNDDNQNLVSMTMGCAINSDKFVMASFGDGYCDGSKFMNVTDDLRSYNRAMSGVRCEKIWDVHSTHFTGDELLAGSSSCDTSYYGNRCPDPYGRKKKYAKLASGGTNYRDSARRFFLHFVRGLAWVLLVLGLVLLAAAFWIKRRYGRSRRRSRKKSSKKRRSKSANKRRSRSRGGDGDPSSPRSGTYDDEEGTYASEYTGAESRRSKSSRKSKSSKSRGYDEYDAVDEASPKSRSSRSATSPRSSSGRSKSNSGKSKREKVMKRLGMEDA